MQTLLIGCGWLGCRLAGALLRDGGEVAGTYRQDEHRDTLLGMGVTPVYLNLDTQGTTPFSVDFEAMPFYRHVVIMLPFSRQFSDPTIYLNQMQALFEAFQERPIDRILFTGSTSIYSGRRAPWHADEDPAVQNDRQAILKAVEDRLLKRWPKHGTVLRLGGIHGYDRDSSALLRRPQPLPNPDHPVNLIHADDAVRQLQLLLRSPQQGAIYNGVCDSHPSRRHFYSRRAAALGLPTPTFGDNNPSASKLVDNSRFKSDYRFSYSWQA